MANFPLILLLLLLLSLLVALPWRFRLEGKRQLSEVGRGGVRGSWGSCYILCRHTSSSSSFHPPPLVSLVGEGRFTRRAIGQLAKKKFRVRIGESVSAALLSVEKKVAKRGGEEE